MSPSPLVSVMIPTYNRFAYLHEAITSVITQTFQPSLEIIVIDNNSPLKIQKEIRKIVESFGKDSIKLMINDENIGLYDNWNLCLSTASGRYVTILNDDDILDQSFFKEILGYLYSHPDCVACGVRVRLIDASSRRINHGIFHIILRVFSFFASYLLKLKSIKITASQLFFSHPFCGSLGIVFDKSRFARKDIYSREFYPISDYIMTYIFASNYHFSILNRELASYRIATNSLGSEAASFRSNQADRQFRNYIISSYPIFKPFLRLFISLKYRRSFFKHTQLWRKPSGFISTVSFYFILFLLNIAYLIIYAVIKLLFFVYPLQFLDSFTSFTLEPID